MGEYAIRKSGGQEVKIGTCEQMYYLRFEDREKVEHLSGNVDPVKDCGELRFRLPFPDEDDIAIGEYKNYSRGLCLYKYDVCTFCNGEGKTHGGNYQCSRCQGNGKEPYCTDFSDPETLSDPGSFQMSHRSGLLLSVPCYHGMKLPFENAHWNGKTHSFELASLRPVGSGILVYPVVRCQHCEKQWRYDWNDVWDYIPADMQQRLQVYKDAFVETAA